MSFRPHLAALLLIMSGCGLSNAPSKTEAGFDQVVTNQTTPAEAVALMGSQPLRRSQTQLLNLVDVQVMEWQDDRYSFVLTFGGSPAVGAEPRVLTKRMQPRTTETN